MIKKILTFAMVLCLLMGIAPINTYAYTQGYDGMGPVVISGGQRDFQWPVPGNYNISSCFYDHRDHCAIDIAASKGTAVVASYDGIVVATYTGCSHNYSKNSTCCNDGFGNYVVLKHNYRSINGSVIELFSRYSHLTSVNVSIGNSIAKGAQVGTVGSTGSSAGFHLDFQILYGNWSPYKTYSIDPYANQLLELPSNLHVSDSWDCGQTYYALIKELYATPVQCSHAYTSEITSAATCNNDGQKTYTCSKCGDSYTETIPATGAHSYGAWKTVTEPGCVTEGLQRQACACGATQTRETSALGHDCAAYYIPATCVEPEFIHYECRRCGEIYNEYGGQWSEFKPSGVPDDQLETKTEYRYAEYEYILSNIPDWEGYDLVDTQWEETGTGNIQYVKSWPSGFNGNHELYGKYNNSAKTNTETSTEKTSLNSEKNTGYIYWHWCRGTYNDGPINRKTSTVQTGEFNTFHAFYSTTNPSTMTAAGDGSVSYPNADCCKDSHWYYNVPVYTQTYTTYEKQFIYGYWTEWFDWTDIEIEATDTCKVESRTLYRYVSGELAECTWDVGVVTTKPTCTSAGVRTYTCTVCGDTKTESVAATGHGYKDGYCEQCSAEDPEYNFVTAKVQVGTVSGKTGDTVTVPVSIADNPGIAGFTFVFDYDTSAMTLTGISKGTVLQDGTFTPNVAGKTLNWFNAVNVTGNGTLFNLTFKLSEAAAVGDYSVTVALKDGKSTNFVNENAKAQRVTFGSGQISVLNPVMLTSVSIQSTPTKISYNIGDGLDTTGLTLKLTYSDGSSKTVTTGFTVSGFDSAIAGTKTVTVTYEGKTTTFTVTVTEPEPEIDENAPQIVVSEAKAMAGDTVTVTVSLKNNPGFSGLNVYVTYADGLTLVEATNSTSLTFTNDRTMVWDGVADYTQDGELMQLTFRISDTAEPGDYAVKVNFIEAYTAELDDVTFATVDGAVQVLDFVYGDANGDGIVNTKDIILIRRHVAAKDPVTGESTVAVQAGADANGDGIVNTKDIILVRRHVAAKDPVTGESSVVLGPTK